MDTITTAIMAALANLTKDAVKDCYEGLKGKLKKKFGETSDLVEAVDKLEKKPDSEARKGMLQEEIEATNAHEDTEIIQLAQVLLDKIKEQSSGQQNITMGNVTATGERSVAIGNLEGERNTATGNLEGEGSVAIGNLEGSGNTIGGVHGKK